ncbi:hypothetical protein I4U23_027228 [Adineta vaga]|nr:hypothetical protein I4U23_027228 [Adineta vaga]
MVGHSLSQSQLYSLVGLGALYWGAAAVTIRNVGHILFANDARRLATFAGLIPTGYMLIIVSEGLLGIHSSQRFMATAVMLAAALPLDGLAFMFFPSLYENPTIKKTNPHSAATFSRMGAASIFWGVGVVLIMALF